MARKYNLHNNYTPGFPVTHDVTCSDCGTLFACACPDVEVMMGTLHNEHVEGKHARRRDRGWPDRCPDCNRKAQEAWSRWLKSGPETRTFDPLPERRE